MASSREIPRLIFEEVRAITLHLLDIGLADDYRMPKLSDGPGGLARITTAPPVNSTVLDDGEYRELYDSQVEQGAFNFAFPDLAICQMSYEFQSGNLVRHRLSYLPSPDLSPYLSDPKPYLYGLRFAEIVGSQVLAVPIRFDFDARPGVARAVEHPVAHISLGQFKNSRIPVSGPVSPAAFLNFVVRCFYTSPDHPRHSYVREPSNHFARTLHEDEQHDTWVSVPNF